MNTLNVDLYTVSGSVTIFCGYHDEQFIHDVLHSCLTAHLAAAELSDHRDDSWSLYQKTLSDLTWVTEDSQSKCVLLSSKSVLELLLEAHGEHLSESDQQALTQAFSVLQDLPKDSIPIQAITRRFVADSAPVMTTPPTVNDPESPTRCAAQLTLIRDNRSIVTLRVTFETRHELDTEILNQPLLRTADENAINAWSLSSTMDSGIYAELSSDIDSYLGDHALSEIIHIHLPAPLIDVAPPST
ncbi:hypothetical protein [Pseudomonas sp. RA_35y_Pfl2_P32]|uniref:hypothetical protein n=1 Tax=Pseudomonas sp. RA_35y_Pfl2_P32 TaxID=3088705 RepID=UPI0030DB6ADE